MRRLNLRGVGIPALGIPSMKSSTVRVHLPKRMRISQEKIEEIRSASDIIEVVSSHVRLKRRGKNYLGLCPFHQEKTPSFSVSPEKQMYYCFGCGVGGNVFTFIMEIEKVSFVEAVRTLAERAGIPIPVETAADREQETEFELLYGACRSAGLFYYEHLTTSVEGKLALEYLHHRAFTDETIRRFGLGYAPNSWDALIKKAAEQGIGIDVLERAGLVIKREDGSGYYDRFRGRAMFPIFSSSGRAIGFGARKLREDDPLGKYINSPETSIYDKSRVLYGLYQAKEAIREAENAILVEGYADLITVFQAGIHNVVASSGTALTEEQIRLVGRYGKSITVVYDADTAGSSATARGVDLIIEQGLDVRVVELPGGEDPDSFVRKHGTDRFKKLVDGAASFLDFKADYFRGRGMLQTPEGQAEAVRSIVATLARMKDELKRNLYVKRLSQQYGIYESILYRELERVLGQERRRSQPSSFAPPPPPELRTPQRPAGSAALPETPPAERDLLKLILEYGNEMLSAVTAHVSADQFTHPKARQLIRLLQERAERNLEWDANTLITALEDLSVQHFIADLVFSRYEVSKGWTERNVPLDEPDPWRIASRSVIVLKKLDLDRRLAENQRRMSQATASGKDAREFLELHHVLLQERKEIEKLRLEPPPPISGRSAPAAPGSELE